MSQAQIENRENGIPEPVSPLSEILIELKEHQLE
jgi:hypothetical protein